ncbi:MAG: hypothetical protein JSS02_14045 [Planctomycetes bacterium]|nr:hypothetical protein [Planctomycetota bacterium]
MPVPIAALRSLLWNQFLVLLWAVWWGGLCFYAVVVVPVATEQIGSVEQGFITRLVTVWHNAIHGVFVISLAVEAYRRRNRTLWGFAGLLAVVGMALWYWHSHLNSMMDAQAKTVPSDFYDQHAIYLWITAIEWGLGLILPYWLFRPRE